MMSILLTIGHARDLIFVGLTPNGFGLGFYAALGAENGDRAVEHTQRTLDLNGEVDVAGGVDDVDTMVLPVSRW